MFRMLGTNMTNTDDSDAVTFSCPSLFSHEKKRGVTTDISSPLFKNNRHVFLQFTIDDSSKKTSTIPHMDQQIKQHTADHDAGLSCNLQGTHHRHQYIRHNQARNHPQGNKRSTVNNTIRTPPRMNPGPSKWKNFKVSGCFFTIFARAIPYRYI